MSSVNQFYYYLFAELLFILLYFDYRLTIFFKIVIIGSSKIKHGEYGGE